MTRLAVASMVFWDARMQTADFAMPCKAVPVKRLCTPSMNRGGRGGAGGKIESHCLGNFFRARFRLGSHQSDLWFRNEGMDLTLRPIQPTRFPSDARPAQPAMLALTSTIQVPRLRQHRLPRLPSESRQLLQPQKCWLPREFVDLHPRRCPDGRRRGRGSRVTRGRRRGVVEIAPCLV